MISGQYVRNTYRKNPTRSNYRLRIEAVFLHGTCTVQRITGTKTMWTIWLRKSATEQHGTERVDALLKKLAVARKLATGVVCTIECKPWKF
jgi:hypothetical protein